MSRRRRRWVILGSLLVVLVVGAVVGGRIALLKGSWFRVSQVEVQAPPGLDPNSLRTAAGVRTGMPLLAVDLDAVGRSVASVPAVASATASRRWPHTLRLTVTERVPVALTPSASGPWLLDADGLAYLPAPDGASALPTVVAARVSPADPATKAALAVLAALTDPVRGQLRAVRADGPNDVTLLLRDGKQVRWGSPEQSERKAMVLQALMTQRGSVYDVSAPDLPTLRR
ncbi:MAG TPA: FtsQ-type POTRA domain-containing protein [Pseudonocardia sp.]|jgi:cell division protein FtsQ|nr:FtsQ-type POTRA domain-containing protein [Pseudonocardia sp.]